MTTIHISSQQCFWNQREAELELEHAETEGSGYCDKIDVFR